MFVLSYLISLALAEVSYSGTTLTITNEATISAAQVSAHKEATSLVITSTGGVTIQDQAFQGFASLSTVSIQGTQISITSTSFTGCTKITSVSLNSPSLSIQNGAFQSAASLTINYTGASFNANMASFATSNVEAFNIDVTGDCTFGLDAALQSTVKRIILKGATVNLGQQSFQQAKSIELIKVEATKTVTFAIDSFNNAQVSEVQVYAGNDITIVQQAFQQVSEIKLLNLTSGGTISLNIDSFISSTIDEVILKAEKDINVGQQAMQKVKNFNKLTVETHGNFEAAIDSFISSMIHEVFIKCDGTATFIQQSFQNTPDLQNLTVIAGAGINFNIDSFISSNVNYMYLYTNGSVTFVQQAFQNTKNLTYFTIHALGKIDFQIDSFDSSNVTEIDLYTNGSVSFGQQAFQDCHNLTNLTIHSPSDITFGLDSFLNSQIQAINITYYNQTSGPVYLADASTVTFNQGSFQNCNQLVSVDVHTKGNVDIKSNSFQDSKSLKTLNVKADGTADVGSGAFAGCSSLTSHTIDSNGGTIDDGAFSGGSGGKKKKHGSSHKDDDSDDESSAKTLGNFDIKTVYLGTSPNIYVNLNFFITLMKKARNTFGRIVPAPEFIHSAIWVGKEGATDDSVGAIFVYGKYWNKHNLPSYLGKDGAKAYVMTLREFKERYPANDPIKLTAHKNIKLDDFIYRVKLSGKWGAKDYNWPTNNCQHFTAKLIGILRATRETPNNQDWANLPKPVMNSLKLNEEFLEK
ncbi:hypothetical protein M9Y10_004044 [Tritrichomonas musculus]|uniref:Uncharacterized protein n=1 Tax=Tritrichomonas musculus TaxID=1915356 RepID=A0ABR2JQY0_9EUKA